MSVTSERVVFRMIQCPKCNHLLCWLNPRLPTYCNECGQMIIGALRTDPSKIVVADHGAHLRYDCDKLDTEESLRLVHRTFLHSDAVAGTIAMQLQRITGERDVVRVRGIVSRAIDAGLREEQGT